MDVALDPAPPITISTGSSTSGPPGPQGAIGPRGLTGSRGPAGEDGTLVQTDGQSITIATPPLPTLSKHIIRRALGSSDCPVVEANVAGQAVSNAAILKAAFETHGHLAAGPNGALYDMGYCAPNIFAKPRFVLEGNQTQTFRGLAANFNNPRTGVAAGWDPGGAMFVFQGTMVNQGLATVAVTYGGRASLYGLNIVGPLDANPSWASFNTVIGGRYIDQLDVERCDISGWSLGAMIALVAVKNGGSLSWNTLHNTSYTAYNGQQQFTAIWVDSDKPRYAAVRGTSPPTEPAGNIAANYAAWTGMGDSEGGLASGGSFAVMDGTPYPGGRPLIMDGNKIYDLRVPDAGAGGPQTDGINVEMFAQNIVVRGGYYCDLGDALDLWCHGALVTDLYIRRAFNGLKLLYGFRDGRVANCNIADLGPGGKGIVVGASGRRDIYTQDITLDGNEIRRVGAGGACIEVVAGPAAHWGYVRNLYVTDNKLDPVYDSYWIIDGAEGNDHHYFNNIGVNRGLTRHFAAVNTIATGGSYKAHDDTFSVYVSAYLAADVVDKFGSGNLYELTGAGVSFTEVVDKSGIFDPATGIATITQSGVYEVSFLMTVADYNDAAHTGLLGFVRFKSAAGAGIKDWTFRASDVKPDAAGSVAVSGMCSERITTAQLPVNVRLAVQATTASSGNVCDLKSNASGFHYSSFIIKRVASA